MSTVTNRTNLPDVFLRAIKNDPYSSGGAQRSVTQLIGPPRIHQLQQKHKHAITGDAVDQIWSLLGRGVHKVLEQGSDGEDVEERFFAEVNGWVISGACDLQYGSEGGERGRQRLTDADHPLGNAPSAPVTIMDYKVTSVWSVIMNPIGKADWIAQQNMYAYLVELNKPVTVTKIQICAILRDWSSRDAKTMPNYPAAPIIVIDLPLWSPEDRVAYVTERVRAHQNAEMLMALDEPLPFCSKEERWQRGDKWAVLKDGGKRALKVFDSEAEAVDYIGDGTHIEYRPGIPNRCAGNYCSVAPFCEQYQGEIHDGTA